MVLVTVLKTYMSDVHVILFCCIFNADVTKFINYLQSNSKSYHAFKDSGSKKHGMFEYFVFTCKNFFLNFKMNKITAPDNLFFIFLHLLENLFFYCLDVV